MLRDDWLDRQIRQLAEAVARIAASRAGAPEELGEAIEEAYNRALGPHRDFLDVVDAGTLAGLLGSDERIRALVEITALDLERTTDEGEARRLRQRGLALLDVLSEPSQRDAELRAALSAE